MVHFLNLLNQLAVILLKRYFYKFYFMVIYLIIEINLLKSNMNFVKKLSLCNLVRQNGCTFENKAFLLILVRNIKYNGFKKCNWIDAN